jgi:hypothetical protein
MDPITNNDLSQFMQELIPAEDPDYIFFNSPSADRIQEVVRHEILTEPIIATFFWQIICHTSFFQSYHKQYSDRSNRAAATPMVVQHGTNKYGRRQYSLLVPVHGLEKTYVHTANKIARHELAIAFQAWLTLHQEMMGNLERTTFNKLPKNQSEINRFGILVSLFFRVQPDFIYLVLDKISMSMVFCKAPEELLTASCFTATPCHTVNGSNGTPSTAGVYGYSMINDNGLLKEVFGVTVSRHALLGSSATHSTVMHQLASINGLDGIVISEDLVSDSCFVALDQTQVTGIVPRWGPLQWLLDPAKKLVFESAAAGKQADLLPVAWDVDILTPQPSRQKRIYTRAVTSPGDSGAALYNEEGIIAGFAFSTTDRNSTPAYSSWIWGDSVFRAHQLKV